MIQRVAAVLAAHILGLTLLWSLLAQEHVANSPLAIVGNTIRDSVSGQEIILYGVHVSRPEVFEPDKGPAFHDWYRVHDFIIRDFEELSQRMHVNAIRVGIEPEWFVRFPERVRQYVQWWIEEAIARKMYVLLDYHAVASMEEVCPANSQTYYQIMKDFWNEFAPRYGRQPYSRYVMFELYNEERRSAENIRDWLDYKQKLESVISRLRLESGAMENIVVINGLNNGLNLRRVNQAQFSIVDARCARGLPSLIAYGWHCYPITCEQNYHNRQRNMPECCYKSWKWNLGISPDAGGISVTELYPVLITEFGWRDPQIVQLPEKDMWVSPDIIGGRYVNHEGKSEYGKALLQFAIQQNVRGFFPFRFWYDKIGLVSEQPDWWHPQRPHKYTSDYGEIIKAWYTNPLLGQYRRLP